MNHTPGMPKKSQIDGLVKAYTKKVSLQQQNAPLKIQQRAHDDFNKKLNMLQDKYPNIDMTSTRFYSQLDLKAKKIIQNKVVRGVGSEF